MIYTYTFFLGGEFLLFFWRWGWICYVFHGFLWELDSISQVKDDERERGCQRDLGSLAGGLGPR